jgi:plastocyanin
MNRPGRRIAGTLATVLGMLIATETAAAGATIVVTRERNKPDTIEVAAGEEIWWINGSGGIAHVWFAGADGPRFYVGDKGPMKLSQPGRYEYTVHVSGTKGHAHTGVVIVK